MSGHVNLAKREFVVVLVVQYVHEIGVERVHFFQLRKLRKHLSKTIMIILLSVLNFAHIKLSDASDFVLLVYHGRGLTLGLRQRQVDKVLRTIEKKTF